MTEIPKSLATNTIEVVVHRAEWLVLEAQAPPYTLADGHCVLNGGDSQAVSGPFLTRHVRQRPHEFFALFG